MSAGFTNTYSGVSNMIQGLFNSDFWGGIARDCVNLALTSGNTASSMYAAFGMLAQTPSLDPNRLTLWWSSER